MTKRAKPNNVLPKQWSHTDKNCFWGVQCSSGLICELHLTRKGALKENRDRGRDSRIYIPRKVFVITAD